MGVKGLASGSEIGFGFGIPHLRIAFSAKSACSPAAMTFAGAGAGAGRGTWVGTASIMWFQIQDYASRFQQRA